MKWETLAHLWVRMSALYGKRILFAGTLVAMSFAAVASRLTLDSNLASLLPENAPSVVGLHEMESRYGDQVGRLTVFVNNVPPEQHAIIGAQLSEALSELDGVHRVVYRRPAELIKSHRLLYLETEDLRQVSKRFLKRIRWEKRKANPFFADLETGKVPELDLTDIEEKYASSTGPLYNDETTGALLVFVHPSFPSLDLTRSRALVRAVLQTSNSVLATVPRAEIELTGRYAKRIETQEILENDLELATSIAFVALLLFLALYFRSFTAVALVLGPLLVGTLGAGAWAWLVFGKLNILTAFLGAILLGLGADFGIHIVSSYLHRRRTLAPENAAAMMLQTAGRAGTYASLTTAMAFFAVALSDFTAFHEFGVIAAGGMVAIVAAFMLLLPSALLLFDSRLTGRPTSKSWLSTHALTLIGERGTRVAAAGLLGILVIAAGWGATQIGFAQSLDALVIRDTPMVRLDMRVNDILGRSQTPALILTKDDVQSVAIEKELSARNDKAIDGVMAEHTLLPAQQGEKLEILKELVHLLEGVPKRARSEELNDWLSEVKTVVDGGELKFSDLPVSITAPFRTKDDSKVVLVFPGVPLDVLESAEEFVASTRGLPNDAYAISESSLLIEILKFVRAELPTMVVWTLMGLVLLTLLGLGLRRDAFVLLIAVAVTVFAAFGISGAVGLEFNFMNSIIVPIWLGLGIDSFYHLVIHQRSAPNDAAGLLAVLEAVGAAIGTSLIGFGALMASHHLGLRSLAVIGVLGLSTIYVVTVLIAVLFFIKADRT